MIFVDSAMGKSDFADQAAKLLSGVVGAAAAQKLTPTDPLITGKFAGGAGCDLSKAVVPGGANSTPLAEMLSVVRFEGRVVAVISRCAVTVPMDGGYTHGCISPSLRDTRRLAANVAIYAATHYRPR